MLKKNFCIYALIYTIGIVILKLIFNLFNLEFLTWIYYASIVFIFLMMIIGIFQLLLKIKKKPIKVISIILFVIISIIISFFGVFAGLLTYVPEYITEKNGTKVIEIQKYWDRNKSERKQYYKYYNIFFRSKNIIDSEHIRYYLSD